MKTGILQAVARYAKQELGRERLHDASAVVTICKMPGMELLNMLVTLLPCSV
jgi:hypothetical protein